MRMLFKLGIGIIAIAFVVYIVLNNDCEPPDDSALILQRDSIPEEDNAFTYLLQAADAYTPDNSSVDIGELLTNKVVNIELAKAILATNDVIYPLIQTALACDKCEAPVYTNFSDRLDYLAPLRWIARLMALQSRIHFAEGQDKMALDTCMDIQRLGHMVAEMEGPIISFLTGVAIKDIAYEQIEQMLPLCNIETETLLAYGRQIEIYRANAQAAINALKSEYAVECSQIDEIADVVAGKKNGKKPLSFAHLPKAKYLLHANRTKAMFADLAMNGISNCTLPYSEMDLSIPHDVSDQEASVIRRLLTPNAVGQILFSMLAPSIDGLCLRMCVVDLYGSAIQTLLALKAHKQDHGSLPDSLNELVPDYLKKVPMDAFDGKALRYDRGKKIVYSVGKDLKDDGGLKEYEHPELPTWWRSKDIVFDIEF